MKKVCIVGGGIFGLYVALEMLKKGYAVDIFEQSSELGASASKVNQARLHLGFHYPRSIETAKACIDGYIKFQSKFPQAINNSFYKYYAIAKYGSKVSSTEYIDFCDRLGLDYRIVNLSDNLINYDNIDLTLEVAETSFDWKVIIDFLEKKIQELYGKIYLNHKVVGGNVKSQIKEIILKNKNEEIIKNYDIVVNATYANINNVLESFELPPEKLEFELCEMALVKIPERYNNIGVTVMDGDFTSIMPFGHSGYQTISNVVYTPHAVSKENSKFDCYYTNDYAHYSKKHDNIIMPKTNFYKMKKIAEQYLPYASNLELIEPLFTVKTILQGQDCTDARPTLIYEYQEANNFYTVFSGKVDTVIDIAEKLIKKIEKGLK